MSDLVDVSFPRAYACEVVGEIPGGNGPRYFYPGGDTLGGRDGVNVRVVPSGGEAWMGTFALGTFGPSGITKVLSMPNPTTLCVVARGAGYLVSVEDPLSWQLVKAVPIIDVRPVPSLRIVVFANFTELVAYGADGIAWRTKRLAWDSLKLTRVTETTAFGEYWDIRVESMQTFEVDLATGRHRGGVEE